MEKAFKLVFVFLQYTETDNIHNLVFLSIHLDIISGTSNSD